MALTWLIPVSGDFAEGAVYMLVNGAPPSSRFDSGHSSNDSRLEFIVEQPPESTERAIHAGRINDFLVRRAVKGGIIIGTYFLLNKLNADFMGLPLKDVFAYGVGAYTYVKAGYNSIIYLLNK